MSAISALPTVGSGLPRIGIGLHKIDCIDRWCATRMASVGAELVSVYPVSVVGRPGAWRNPSLWTILEDDNLASAWTLEKIGMTRRAWRQGEAIGQALTQ